MNADQSGFNHELVIPRTLSNKCGKQTFCLIQNTSATTHSYSIMPTLNSNGLLVGKMLIVLKEDNGIFGPRIKLEIQELEKKCSNLMILCSKSGKFETVHMEIYKTHVLKKHFGNEKFYFMHDGWNG